MANYTHNAIFSALIRTAKNSGRCRSTSSRDYPFTMIFTSICHIVLLLISISSTTCTALNRPPTLPSLPQLLNSSLLQNLTYPEFSRSRRCTRKKEWFSPPFVERDCQSALQYFWLKEFESPTKWNQEFLAEGAKKTARYKTQQTPRKYTFSKSVLNCMVFLHFLRFSWGRHMHNRNRDDSLL